MNQLDRNRLATQLAGASVTHFLEGDKQSLEECIGQIPDPPGPWVGMLRFATLAITVIAQDSGADATEIARQMILRIAELE